MGASRSVHGTAEAAHHRILYPPNRVAAGSPLPGISALGGNVRYGILSLPVDRHEKHLRRLSKRFKSNSLSWTRISIFKFSSQSIRVHQSMQFRSKTLANHLQNILVRDPLAWRTIFMYHLVAPFYAWPPRA